jgi:hypothetical protein
MTLDNAIITIKNFFPIIVIAVFFIGVFLAILEHDRLEKDKEKKL